MADCSMAIANNGNVINLNGQPWSGRWLRQSVQGQPKFYVQEDWLTQGLGVQMLDSDNADRQRVRWFSAPVFSQVAFDRTGRYRYLELSPFAELWRTEVVGNTLNLYTPDTKIQALRRSKQPWGDRLVIDLDRRTPWRVSQQANLISLIVSAEVAADLPLGTDAIAGNLIKSVTIQPQGKMTQIQIQTTESINPAIELLSSPNPKIVLDLRRDYTPPDLTIQWAKGLKRIERTVEIPNQTTVPNTPTTVKFAVTALEVDLKQPQLTMRPIWSNPSGAGVLGLLPLPQMAEQAEAVAAINAGFFNRIRQLPVGAIRQGNRWIAGTALVRGAIAWNESGEVLIDRLNFNEAITVSNQTTINLTNLNSGYVQRGIARYTPSWGSTYSPLTENEILIVVRGEQVVAQYQGGAVGVGQVTIPSDGYLLVARQTPNAIAQLPVGAIVRGRQSFVPKTFANFPNLIGAGPLLLKNSKTVLDGKIENFQAGFDTQPAPRSAIATTKTQGKLLLTTIQAIPNGTAPNLAQTAEVLKKLGAVDALNLDGGSSSSIYLGGNLLNRAITQIAPVHNAIAIFITPPTPQPQF
ncbi:MAG: phosphodiester glycosidase family protein [Pseudanabaenaceae cyanobacterium bins.39]|nr:phosphodiester glycosidase family protein [Pseudanabaenaceae cyanobacterium bins.39]